jgi:hypothetical protein
MRKLLALAAVLAVCSSAPVHAQQPTQDNEVLAATLRHLSYTILKSERPIAVFRKAVQPQHSLPAFVVPKVAQFVPLDALERMPDVPGFQICATDDAAACLSEYVGVVFFAPVTYDAAGGAQVLVSVMQQSGPNPDLDGMGFVVDLRRHTGKWVVVAVKEAWVS